MWHTIDTTVGNVSVHSWMGSYSRMETILRNLFWGWDWLLGDIINHPRHMHQFYDFKDILRGASETCIITVTWCFLFAVQWLDNDSSLDGNGVNEGDTLLLRKKFFILNDDVSEAVEGSKELEELIYHQVMPFCNVYIYSWEAQVSTIPLVIRSCKCRSIISKLNLWNCSLLEDVASKASQ